ncbi:MAG: PhoX family phosphatase [Gammaproteobacteria bacterium]|nr:PhoX family phosphatase [Gammaproteobacteria bacterium]
MTIRTEDELSFDEFDELHDPRTGPAEFDAIAQRFLSRRRFLQGTTAVGASAFVLGTGMLSSSNANASEGLSFDAVSATTEDTITLPPGYKWQTVIRWGDPLWSDAVPFDPVTRGSGSSQERAFGDNTDGMSLFVDAQNNTVLTVNNEFVNRKVIYGNRGSSAPENADDVRKGKAGHGVSVFQVSQQAGQWKPVLDAKYNRRITADTPMTITGPARGHDLLKTAADPTGTTSLGTWNNCANGKTPWGTYLACEENFNGYFSSSDPGFKPTPEMKRYGLRIKDWGYAWATADERFDLSRHPNEPNRAGWVVEIDPLDPTSTPKKRTAMGRLKHENAEVVVAKNNKVVVYLGDDERGEFLYRFISEGTYSAGGDNADLLETGQLSVAKFSDDGRGQWMALTSDTTGMTQAEICIYTRMAASKVGATTMDRPEWITAHPGKAEVYCTLTNNKNRGKKPNAGGDPTPVGGPNPRAGNKYGQIVRWQPDEGDHTADGFAWDLFVTAGNPTVHKDDRAGSKNVTPDNMFNSPDGIAFDSKGRLWIQTDGNYSNAGDFAGQGNNQMLLGNTETGEIKRFMVGPKQCEVTGLCWSPDRKTMFVGIQHPGYKGEGNFPGGGDSVPRSSIVAITRDDGGELG